MKGTVEKWYSVRELAFLLELHEVTIRRYLSRVEPDGSLYWPNWTELPGGDVRIPATDVNRRLEESRARRLGQSPAEDSEGSVDELGMVARRRGELMRKMRSARKGAVVQVVRVKMEAPANGDQRAVAVAEFAGGVS